MTKTNVLPSWLMTLPKGEYTLTQLATITDMNKANIVRILKKLNVAKNYKSESGKYMREATYIWPGIIKEVKK